MIIHAEPISVYDINDRVEKLVGCSERENSYEVCKCRITAQREIDRRFADAYQQYAYNGD